MLRFAVPLAALALLWFALDMAAVGALLASADPALLCAALAALACQNALSALRWARIARRLGQPIGDARALGEYFLSQFLNMTLPAGVLGDVGRAVRMRGEAGLLRASQAVVIERMVGQVTLFAVLGAGLALAMLGGEQAAWPGWVAGVLAVAGAFAVVAAAAVFAARLRGRLGRASAGFVEAVRASVLAREAWRGQAILSLCIVACNLGGFALCAAATGTELGMLAIVTVVPLVLVAMVLPVSVAGWGVREGAAAALWPLVGAAPEAGVAASIAFGLVILVASLPGALGLLAPSQADSRSSLSRATSGTPRSEPTPSRPPAAGPRDDHAASTGAKSIGRNTGSTK
jgi:uncharacterized membrane protein YbhN (UPF0104 family)